MIDQGLIYFAQVGDDGPIKVGYSTNPSNRVAQLQGSHYERIHLIGLTAGSRANEEQLHSRLERFCLGREWYPAIPEIFAEIEETVTRVHVALDTAVVAREHLQRAIALLRGSDSERGCEELRRVLECVTEALASTSAVAA